MCFESWSDEENDLKSKQSEDKSTPELCAKPLSNETRRLLSRKEELEQKQKNEELMQKRVQVSPFINDYLKDNITQKI